MWSTSSASVRSASSIRLARTAADAFSAADRAATGSRLTRIWEMCRRSATSTPVAKVPRRGNETTSRSASSRLSASRTGVRPNFELGGQLTLDDGLVGANVEHDQPVPDHQVGVVGERHRLGLDAIVERPPTQNSHGPTPFRGYIANPATEQACRNNDISDGAPRTHGMG